MDTNKNTILENIRNTNDLFIHNFYNSEALFKEIYTEILKSKKIFELVKNVAIVMGDARKLELLENIRNFFSEMENLNSIRIAHDNSYQFSLEGVIDLFNKHCVVNSIYFNLSGQEYTDSDINSFVGYLSNVSVRELRVNASITLLQKSIVAITENDSVKIFKSDLRFDSSDEEILNEEIHAVAYIITKLAKSTMTAIEMNSYGCINDTHIRPIAEIISNEFKNNCFITYCCIAFHGEHYKKIFDLAEITKNNESNAKHSRFAKVKVAR